MRTQLILLFMATLAYAEQDAINIMFVNDEMNEVASRSFESVLLYIKRNGDLSLTIGRIDNVTINATDPQFLLDTLCQTYAESVKAGEPPHVLIDATLSGDSSEVVKAFSASLALPTVSGSYGQEGDIRQWRDLDEEQLKYLIQVQPPGYLIPEAIRTIVVAQNLSSAGILFDDSFEMDHKYKSLLQNIPARHIISPLRSNINEQLDRLRQVDVNNFFILGRLSTIKDVLEVANAAEMFTRKYAWHALTQDNGPLRCPCNDATILYLKPVPDTRLAQRLALLKAKYSLPGDREITAAFYFDLALRALLAVRSMIERNDWPVDMQHTLCPDYREDQPIRRTNLDLQMAFRQVQEPGSYAKMQIERNGRSHLAFTLRLEKVSVVGGRALEAEDLGSWPAGIESQLLVREPRSLANLTSVTVYRVVTAIQPPFVMHVPEEEQAAQGGRKFRGYCIDLLEEIRRIMGFEYEIYEAPDHKFGSMDEQGNWDGMIKELKEKRADIALSSLPVNSERETVIDFTVPYYDLVGYSILMKKLSSPTSLFKFLTVLETDVWLCILAAYFITSLLMWIFDRWSPYSYQNNREKYKNDEEKREFNLRECLWFCMTSLTPQGGGEAPKNLSGRLVAATWWLFGFIIIASYTANLAAFLTVSRLDTPVESLADLSQQYKTQYAPLNGSDTMIYFQRMMGIEQRFYEIWKDMSLNDSLTIIERAKLAVWDYPVSDRYTKMWQAMLEAGLPSTMEEAVERVKISKSSSEGFAFLGDATDIRYQVLTNCDMQMVGEEFSRKPYAIAVQQGSPLKDQFNNAILQLLNKRKLEKLKEIWWNQNPEKKICDRQDDQADGISIHNIGGVFIVIAAGIVLACFALAFEFWWYKAKRPDINLPHQEPIEVKSRSKLGMPSTSGVPASDILPHGLRSRMMATNGQWS
ncbi:ionotropic receptor 25a [Neocloeon triangulifer]|uniref:ionotropic receptor 25a n=1 Tax=Neocloeon triangulifer TaxID=2078957 RepID=UPI00286EF4EA|nr:ionotropic receptor 25a [Neocloeon triangulifer]